MIYRRKARSKCLEIATAKVSGTNEIRQEKGPRLARRNKIIRDGAPEEVLTEVHEAADAASWCDYAQYEAQENGKDQAHQLFEYEGWLMAVKDIHQKTTYSSNLKAKALQKIGGRPSGLISWTQLFRRVKSSISSNGKRPAPLKVRRRKFHPARNNSATEVEMKVLKE